MSQTCETVKIITEAGMTVIMNKSDYNPEIHTLASEAEEKPGKATKADIMDELDALGIEYDKSAKKAELEAILASEADGE